jgi:hypothetical protein
VQSAHLLAALPPHDRFPSHRPRRRRRQFQPHEAGRRSTLDPAAYERNARFVSDLGTPALDLLAPRPGERILDLGCGDGAP